MYKISIDDIEKEKNKTYHIDFDDDIPELKAHVTAGINLVSLGDFIEAAGDVRGKIKLECDLCLKEFDYKLDFFVKEMYAKTTLFDEPKQETELKNGQFVTDLNGENEIDVYDLLYQSVILQLPNKKVCGINCNEGKFAQDSGLTVQDERMAIFKTIKIENK
ncbi:MAG: DUF177 domain-containing protein [Candidatus Gastranaerophilales bacterium]|nr:DUF177 domain-containing protein [Candidatus Gastranaerophilales bacterium]